MTTRTFRRETAIRLATTQGYVTFRQLAETLLASDSAIQRDLAALVKAGKLVKEGKGRGIYYRPPDPK